jgi:hypothetical protein
MNNTWICCEVLVLYLSSVSAGSCVLFHLLTSTQLNHAKTHFLYHFGDQDLNPPSVDQKFIMLTITP